jgi:hypothetical protein
MNGIMSVRLLQFQQLSQIGRDYDLLFYWTYNWVSRHRESPPLLV